MIQNVDDHRIDHASHPSDKERNDARTDTSYSFSYLALFDSKEAKETYLRHPLHLKFFHDFGPPTGVFSKVLIYDSLTIAG